MADETKNTKKQKFVDYYSLLNISQTDDLTEIENAYRILKNDCLEENTPLSKKRLSFLDKAIDILLNSEKKNQYDADYEANLIIAKDEDRIKKSFIDYTQFRLEVRPNWKSEFDANLPIAQLMHQLISAHTELPNAEIQVPILAASIIAPTVWTNCLPLIFFNGVSGSGKTQLIQFVRNCWNVHEVLNSNSSGKAIRNKIVDIKYEVPGYERSEKIIHGIVFDDVSAKTFKESNYLYDLLKGGYIRGSDTIEIANAEGGNIKFKVFGSRAFSSIVPLDTISEFSELARRLLNIHTIKNDNVSVINPEIYDWNGLHDTILNCWKVDNIGRQYSELLFKLNQDLSLGKFEGKMKAWQATVSLAAIASGLMMGIWEHEQEAIASVAAYWEFNDAKKDARQPVTLLEIKKFLKQKKDYFTQRNEPIEFANKELMIRLDSLKRSQCLDLLLSVEQVAQIVKEEGWILSDGCWSLPNSD